MSKIETGVVFIWSNNPDPNNFLICSLNPLHIFEKPPRVNNDPSVCGYCEPNYPFPGRGEEMVSICPACYRKISSTVETTRLAIQRGEYDGEVVDDAAAKD